MPSTFPVIVKTIDDEPAAVTGLRWRSWPLVDHARWSWLVLLGLMVVGNVVAVLSGSWLLALSAAFGLAATLWQFFVPVQYETGVLGLRITALGRTRFVPWQAIRAYQLRGIGILLYRHPAPTKTAVLRSLFVPYPADEDEALCAFREHLSHAVELPE